MPATNKTAVIEEHRLHDKDTGSTEVQIALLTTAINALVEHLKIHKKDFHTRRGLLIKVGKRRRLMRYLKRTNPVKYAELIAKLQLKG